MPFRMHKVVLDIGELYLNTVKNFFTIIFNEL